MSLHRFTKNGQPSKQPDPLPLGIFGAFFPHLPAADQAGKVIVLIFCLELILKNIAQGLEAKGVFKLAGRHGCFTRTHGRRGPLESMLQTSNSGPFVNDGFLKTW